MATADNDLQFLEGETFHTQKEANKGQVAVKRSSTLKSTKRRTLAKESTKPKLSVEGNRDDSMGVYASMLMNTYCSMCYFFLMGSLVFSTNLLKFNLSHL